MTQRSLTTAAALSLIALGAGCARHAQEIRFGSVGWGGSDRELDSAASSTTLLPPGWKPAGTSSTSPPESESSLSIPIHIAVNEHEPEVIYVNMTAPDSMFGWQRVRRGDVGSDLQWSSRPTERGAESAVPPPSVLITIASDSRAVPSEIGQGIWVGTQVLTARHVTESLVTPGAQLGLNHRFVSHEFVATGRVPDSVADGAKSVAESLALRVHDWSVLRVGEASPFQKSPTLALARRGQLVHVVGYDPHVPGGGLLLRPLRVVALIEENGDQVAYLLRSEGAPVERGWSGAFIGRLRSPNDWQFVAILNGVVEIDGRWYVTATRPPRQVLERLFSAAGKCE